MNKPQTINLESIVVQAENLASSELDGETVLMGPTWAAYYGLDSTARSIWDLIARPRRVSEVCEQLIARYAVERQTCEQQVCAFLSELHKEGLVSILPETGKG
jgi:hypothetical protein